MFTGIQIYTVAARVDDPVQLRCNFTLTRNQFTRTLKQLLKLI